MSNFAISTLPNVNSASLPRTYEAAKTALAECSNIDECQTWADKAAALASYAKQSKDESLMKYAVRIRDRAIRRTGELLKQIEPQQGGDRKSGEYLSTGTGTLITRSEAAEQAGLSKRQKDTAIQVANIPAAQFEALVESDSPPSVTKLAEIGTQAAPKPKSDPLAFLNGRDPKEWGRSAQFIGAFEDYLTTLNEFDLDVTLSGLKPEEAGEVRTLIAKIDTLHDAIATRI